MQSYFVNFACAYHLRMCPSLSLSVLFSSRVALGAQRLIVVKLSRERSVCRSVCTCVGRSVRRSVCRSVCPVPCGKTPDRIHHRSDEFRDEAGSGVWGSVHGKWYFWGESGARHCNQWGLCGVRVRQCLNRHTLSNFNKNCVNSR